MSAGQDTMKESKNTKSAKETKGITINVMGREFRVAAPDGEERQLAASVDLLNKKMKEIRDSGKVVGNERIAIMVALNIAHEHLHTATHRISAKTQNISVDEEYVRRKMQDMESLIEKAVSDQEKLF